MRSATRFASSNEVAVPCSGCGMPSFVQQRAEALAVFGEVDGVGRSADDGRARFVQTHGEVQRRLAAELDDDAFGLFNVHDVHHVLERQRLEVEAVGRVVVGRDRLGVAVDHDGLEPGLAQREGRVAAAVVELDALPDAVRPRAEDHHLAAVGGRGLVLFLVSRVEVRREGLELRAAGVDALVDGDEPRRLAVRAHLELGAPRQVREPAVGQADLFELAQQLDAGCLRACGPRPRF